MEKKGEALFGKYEVGRLLGCGAFAKVYYGRNLVNNGQSQSVAIKVINKKKLSEKQLMRNIKREISIMHRLKHPNIVGLYEVLASKSKIYFIMEYVKGGELFAKVAKGRFSEDLARKYFQQLISALCYCHSRGVYHRDLKPENLLLDENGDLKVSDFGLSCCTVEEHQNQNQILLQTLCGTPAYVAPEILAKKGYHGSKVDIWSSGVILFVLTAGYLPFNHPNLMAMYKKIYNGEFKCPKWMSSDLNRFLSRLLHTNPATRITIDQIMLDPWFTATTPFSVSFHHHDCCYYDKDNDYLNLVSASASSSTASLNAFDLISFSSGLDLSALIDHSFNPIGDGDRFVSAHPAHHIINTIQEVTKAENVHLHVKSSNINLVGPNANFVAKVDIRPLTEKLVVVEVMKKFGDSTSFRHLWNKTVRPHLSRFIHDPQPDPDPDPDPGPDLQPSTS